MKIEQYPTSLVPLDIAKELKKIGFDKPCVYYTNEQLMASTNPYTYDSLKTHIYKRNEALITDIGNHNIFKNRISVPVWDDVFEWFRKKKLFSTIDFLCNSYIYNIKHTETPFFTSGNYTETYDEVRETLLLKLIAIYKAANQ
ncbi:hypothetical protein [Capnocytophaga sputigena]|uniref:hypothetical protein n=1 Tax=Capnocytophaga sputigena TaxID=1019 RepID=UPI00248D3BF4|nr:hypothetical protein [Capnocytophaga sputigena]